MKPFKPLLAGVLATTEFPYIASPKLDGIRCVVPEQQPVSRTLKAIPNKHIQSVLSQLDLKGLDGELIVGNPTNPLVFKNSTSFVMSGDRVRDDWVYWVFDDFSAPLDHFRDRFDSVISRVDKLKHPNIRFVPHNYVYNEEQLNALEEMYLYQGFEGVMLRDPDGIYKYGRSTVKDNILLKMKRFKDDEAVIIGFEEMMTNNNPKTTNELGDSSRSSHQENMIPANTLGSLTVRSKSGIIFSIGSGFTLEERKEIWDNQTMFIGGLAKYKYFAIGEYEKPRFPIYLGFRDVGF